MLSEADDEVNDSLWYGIDGNKVELSNLIDGNYNMLFRTSDNAGNASPIKSLRLEVYPPWYRDTARLCLVFPFSVFNYICILYTSP